MDTTSIIISIIAAVLTFSASVLAYYMNVRKKIESAALGAINDAEDLDAVGAEKFKQAVDAVMSVIPAVAKPFISRNLVENIVQKVFDQVEEFAKKQTITKTEEK